MARLVATFAAVVALSSTSPAVAGVAFAPVQTYPVGSHPRQVVTGHFNRDGFLDLATVNDNAVAGSQISVLLSNGPSTYSTVNLANTDNAKSVAAGDIDGDGDDDLAIANNSSADGADGVSVLLNRGGGTFEAPAFHDVSQPGVPWGIAITNTLGGQARSNAGGDLTTTTADLVVTSNAAGVGSTTVFQNDGHGNLTEQPAVLTYTEARGVVPAELNGDYYIDLLVAAGGTPGGAYTLLNDVGVYGAASALGLLGVGGVESVAAGDLTSDGSSDLVVPSPDEDTVRVVANDGSGDFSPAASTTISVGDAPVAAAVTDFDRDGLNDLAVANSGVSNDVSLSLGVTAATTSAGLSLGSGVPAGSPRFLVATDLNGDAYPDIAATDDAGAVSVWFAVPPTADFSPDALDFGATPIGMTASSSFSVTNRGPQTLLLLLPARLSGVDADEYRITASTCHGALPPGTSCRVGVDFTPSEDGTRLASIELPTTGRGGPNAVPLRGVGAVSKAAAAEPVASQQVAGARATPRQCVVPKLRNKTLKSARKLLKKARCRLGKVKKARISKKAKARIKAKVRSKRYKATTVVYKQSPKAKKRVKQNAKVTVTVRTKLKKVRKSARKR
jgi:hypothetical protein